MLNINGHDAPDLRRCPYCAELILLRTCPIVAREFVATGGAGPVVASASVDPFAGPGFLSGVVDLDEDEVIFESDEDEFIVGSHAGLSPSMVSQSDGRKMFGRRPVLVSADAVERAFVAADGHLAPVGDLAPRRDSPARACADCTNLLPGDLDDRDVYVIGVVGTQGAGKTHFIATALAEAYHGADLERFGFRRFRPAEDSEDDFYADYYSPVYQLGRTLAKTHETVLADGPLAPLVFRFEIDTPEPARMWDRIRRPNPDRRRISVLVHDLPGEALREPEKRRRYAGILHHADALIFLVDAMSFPRVRASANKRHPDAGLPTEDLGFSQSGLINALADELGDEVASRMPVSVALTKGDLILEAIGNDRIFAEPAPADPNEHFVQMRRISDDVHRLITEELGDMALARAADAFPRATYHAIASLGSQPTENTDIPTLKPIRCLDPLISALTRVT